MYEYQERVINEKLELDGKINKLYQFILSNNIFKTLSTEEQNLLQEQLTIMSDYSYILYDIIGIFKKEHF